MCLKLADMAASEVKKKAKALLVPVGSLEDHGPLPLGLDTKIAERVACAVKDAVVTPSINYSFSPEHPFSVTIPLPTLTKYLLDLSVQLYKLFEVPVIYVVAHKGAVPVVNSVVMEAYRMGVRTASIDLWAVIEGMGYKDFQQLCRAEASLALALGYSVVVRKAKKYESPPQLEGATVPWHSGKYGCSPESVAEAKKDEGELILRKLVEAVERLVKLLEGTGSG